MAMMAGMITTTIANTKITTAKAKERKNDNKCGGKKKCPTPIVERIHHPGGGPGPRPGTGPTIGEGLGNIGKLPGGPALGDPGYSAPPAAGSSGGGGAGSPGGPSRDPVENGSGTTLKPN